MLNNFPKFRFWCYKVLPLVYDDSLSYYEVLCKVVKYIDALIEQDKIFADEIEDIENEIKVIQQWIDNFDTEVAEQIIREALANVTSVIFTSLIADNEEPDEAINTAFTNGCKTVIVDADINVKASTAEVSHRIDVPSGCTIRGSGGKITFESGSGFRVDGRKETPVTTIVGDYTNGEAFTVADSTNIEVGERYKIVGVENLFNRNDQYSLGFGTENVTTVYGGFECIVTGKSGNNITINRWAPYYVGSAILCKTNDAENVVFENLKIKSNDHAIWMKYVNNCVVKNCEIENDTQYPLYLSSAYDCTVDGCVIYQNQEHGIENNSVVINSGGENVISNCRLIGGYQAVDITFGHGPYYSYENIVTGNVVFGQKAVGGDSLNTHPAAISNVFSNNICSNSIRIRGKYNSAIGNKVNGSIIISGRSVDGTLISGNIINGLRPIRMSYVYGIDEDEAGTENIYIVNNIFQRCAIIVDGEIEGNYLKFYIVGNTAIAAQNIGTILDNNRSDSGTPVYDSLMISNNNFFAFGSVRVFGTYGGSVGENNFNFCGNCMPGATTSYHAEDGEIEGAKVFGNDAYFPDTLTSFRRNSVGVKINGTNYGLPTNPSIGDTYLDADDVWKIYTNSGWKTISFET